MRRFRPLGVRPAPPPVTTTSTYGSSTTTVVDPAGSKRDLTVDGLNRLASVVEYPANGTTYTTTYTYDALGDLTFVNQSGQNRKFVYDSLKRLIASTNPENFSNGNPAALGCVNGISPYANCYYYDSNGNLTQKTDNRGVGVAYAYDALNRVQSKTYFNLPQTVNYIAVSYTYDQSNVNYSKGRLTSVANFTQAGAAISTTNYLKYDPLGRILSSSQTTAGNTYAFAYGYNLADGLTQETYPSGRTVQTCYDAANRVSQIGVPNCGTATGAYVSNLLYSSHNAPTQYVLGNKIWHEPSYNSRLQMAGFQDLLLGTTSLLNATLNWGTTSNNGNLQGSTYVHAGPGFSSPLTLTQAYTYDGVNRLQGLTDAGYGRTFAYGPFGNMCVTYNSASLPIAGNTPTSCSAYNSNNQFTSGTYDQAGNETVVNGNNAAYDFESRQISISGTGVSESYVYDGDGRRVQKVANGSSSTTAVFVYDAQGRMAAEYSTATDTPSCVTCYLSPDHLGTARLVADQNGNVTARHDYLPFGEEIGSNQAGRGPQWGPLGDSINQKFTGKERDSESGLDYFGARYYGSALGRFTSADWSESPEPVPYADFENPQSLNLYSYVGNDPLSNADSEGHEKCADGTEADACVTDKANPVSTFDWDSVNRIAQRTLDVVSQAADQFTNVMRTPGGAACMGSLAAGGGTAGAVVGGGVGLVGLAGGGVAVVATEPAGLAIGGVGGAASGLALAMTICPGGAANGGGGRASGGSARLTKPQQRQTAKYLGMKEVKGVTSQGQPVFEKDGRYFSFSNTSHTQGEVFKEVDRNGGRLFTTDIDFNRIGR